MVALAIANTILIRRTVFRQLDPEGRVPAMGRVLAAASCFLWLAVITAGRLMAYLGAESGAK
jgi:hypothetical protein